MQMIDRHCITIAVGNGFDAADTKSALDMRALCVFEAHACRRLMSGYSSSYLYTCLFSTLNLAALKCLSETHINI